MLNIISLFFFFFPLPRARSWEFSHFTKATEVFRILATLVWLSLTTLIVDVVLFSSPYTNQPYHFSFFKYFFNSRFEWKNKTKARRYDRKNDVFEFKFIYLRFGSRVRFYVLFLLPDYRPPQKQYARC